MENLLEKTSSKNVMLVVILPEIELLEVAFQTTTCSGKASKGLCHQADWSDWLCKLDTAVFANLTVIMPFVDINTFRNTFVWQTILRRQLRADIVTKI